MHFTFQESMIWEVGDPPDYRSGLRKRVKAKSAEKALRRLPPNSNVGRKWVLVDPAKEACLWVADIRNRCVDPEKVRCKPDSAVVCIICKDKFAHITPDKEN